jgi:LuxR family transcriptional regulator of csgAB operon
MQSSIKVGKVGHSPAPSRRVIVVGRSNLQNNLLADLVDQFSGCSCLLRTAQDLNGIPDSATTLVLLDIEGIPAPAIAASLESVSEGEWCRNIAVINADETVGFEQIVVWPGVKGIFFRKTSKEDLIKGIHAIFNGDYWLPRKILCAHLERTRSSQRPAAAEVNTLTRKEIETLKLVASGNSTHNIAHMLNVSPHTVKTHIYNLFRKIRVSNRVQAAHWALQNIEAVRRKFV